MHTGNNKINMLKSNANKNKSGEKKKPYRKSRKRSATSNSWKMQGNKLSKIDSKLLNELLNA